MSPSRSRRSSRKPWREIRTTAIRRSSSSRMRWQRRQAVFPRRAASWANYSAASGYSPVVNTRWRMAAIALFLGASSRALDAQWGVWPGDSLLAIGRLASAESAYYAAVRVRPRDPTARTALGRYLAARGATRVGAVLLEEARFFGGDSISLARALVPLYERLGDFAAIDSLKPNVLTVPERRRARWLRDRPPHAAFK